MTLKLPPHGGDPRMVATTVNQLIDGKINSLGSVTLAAGAGSTIVGNPLVSSSSAILLFPQTANAAAILAATYVAPGGISDGESFTVTHANDANADKSFWYVVLG